MWNEPNVYDIEFAYATEDLSFWATLLDSRSTARVLELACGTGRVLLHLVKHCHDREREVEFVGLDSSPTFLNTARTKISGMPAWSRERISFIEADMREFDVDGSFDLILIAFNSFPLLVTLQDQLNCLQCAKQHLAAGGIIALDINTPPLQLGDPKTQSHPPLLLFNDMPVPELGVSRFVQYTAFWYETVSQTLYRHSNKVVEFANGEYAQKWDGFQSHVFFPCELDLLFSTAQLNVKSRFGDYHMGPLDTNSKTSVWVVTT